jgi:methyltransferase (TIGR00027 family)
VVAVMRAGIERGTTPGGDPGAQAALCRDMAVPPAPAFLPQLVERTRFFDASVTTALALGFAQIVILGAGYDDRALRFRSPGVRYFEVDQPATQSDKAARLDALDPGDTGPELVPADFRTDDVAAALARAGHDRWKASLFVCEGLLVYLEAETIVMLLAQLKASAGDDSVLAASLAVHPDGVDSARAVAWANGRRRSGQTEPWRTILSRAGHAELLAASGWSIRDGSAAPWPTGREAGSSWLVTAEPIAGHPPPA